MMLMALKNFINQFQQMALKNFIDQFQQDLNDPDFMLIAIEETIHTIKEN